MGIKNLFSNLRSLSVERRLSDFANKKAGIDGNGWIFQIYHSQHMSDLEASTPGMLRILEQRLRLLERNSIEPLFVFDGNKLPCKSQMNQVREDRRAHYSKQTSKGSAESLDVETLEKFHRYSEYASESFLSLFLDFLTFRNIKFMVAPYEADSQLTWLFLNSKIDLVISEDSDLVAFGCTEILRKFSLSAQVLHFSFQNITEEADDHEHNFVKLGEFTRLRNKTQSVHYERLRLPAQQKRNRIQVSHDSLSSKVTKEGN